MKICCMNLAIAVRIIGCLGLLGSLGTLGTLWRTVDIVNQDETADEFRTYVARFIYGLMAYTCCYLVCCALLIYASIEKRWAYTVPWLVFVALGLVLQCIGLIFFICVVNAKEMYIITITTFFTLVVAVYFWICVLTALREWKKESRDRLAGQGSRVGVINSEIGYFQISKLPV